MLMQENGEQSMPSGCVVTKTLAGGMRSSYLIEVSGPEAAVDEWVTAYMREYHPDGYRTGVVQGSISYEGLNKTLKVSRYASCD